MRRTIGVIGNRNLSVAAAALAMLGAGVDGVQAIAEAATKGLKRARVIGTNPTPESIARRARRNTTRLINKANSGFIYHPTVKSRADAPESDRAQRRRAQLGRA